MYNEYLSGNKKIIIPTSEKKTFHVYHQYVVKLKVDKKNSWKDFLRKVYNKYTLSNSLHKQKAYKINKSLPATEKISKQILVCQCIELNGIKLNIFVQI